MSDNAKRLSELPLATSVKSNDLVVIAVANTSNSQVFETRRMTTNTFFSNVNSVIINKSTTPANSTPTSLANKQFWFDDNYLYVVVANNTVIKRVALTSF